MHIIEQTRAFITQLFDTYPEASTTVKQVAQNESLTNIACLPPELLSSIFSYLEFPKTFFNVALTSKQWQQLSTSETLWKNIIATHFPNLSQSISRVENETAPKYYHKLESEMKTKVKERRAWRWTEEFFTPEKLASLTVHIIEDGIKMKYEGNPIHLIRYSKEPLPNAFGILHNSLYSIYTAMENSDHSPIGKGFVIALQNINASAACIVVFKGKAFFADNNNNAIIHSEVKEIIAGTHPQYRLKTSFPQD